MSNYILSPDGELMHYGVKGQKWGVRRAIGKNARTYATAKELHDISKKTSDTLKKKSYKSPQLKGKIKDMERYQASLQKVMKKLAKDLSPADIEQGRRAIKGRAIASGLAIGPVGVGLYKGLSAARVERLREED